MTQTAKRRGRGDGGLYQRASDGMWVGNLDLGYRDGKRRRKVVYGKTKTEARRKLDKVKTELAAHGDLPTGSVTVAEWLDRWIRELAAQRVKPKTLATYRTYVREYLTPCLGRKRLDKLQPADVRELHRYVTSRGLSSTTALHAHRILSTALQAAMREQILMRNVATLVDAPRRAVNTRTGLAAEQARAVLRAAQDDRMASRWLFALLTGARQGETLGLRWEYVDLDAGTVDLAWSLQRVPYQHGCNEAKPGHRADRCPARHLEIAPGYEHEILDGSLVLMRPKTKGSRRVVPLAPPLWAALKLRRAEYLAERDSYTTDHDLVWCRDDGRPVDGRQDWRQWKALLSAAGAPDVSLHESRNTAASLLRDAGVDDMTAAQILGHSDVVVTRAYQRKDLGFARDAVAKLGDTLALD